MEAVPDQLVFSSDWPFIGLDLTRWDPGKMVDLFDAWTPDEALRQKVFVDTPARFYGAR
jgi:predicted TIM-barrel fold metal-dependent hydrolase